MLINFIFFWLSLINFQNTGNLIIEFDTTLNQENLLVYIYDNPEGFPTKPQKAFLTKIVTCQNINQIKINNALRYLCHYVDTRQKQQL